MKPPPLPMIPKFAGAGTSAAEEVAPDSGSPSSSGERKSVRPPPLPSFMLDDSPYAALAEGVPPSRVPGEPVSPPPKPVSGPPRRPSDVPVAAPSQPPALGRAQRAAPSARPPADSRPDAGPGGLRTSQVVPANRQELQRVRYYDPGFLRQLTNELERRYELTELMELCAVQLNILPESLGGTGAKAPFARAMVEACVEQDSVWALLDALRLHHGVLHPLLQLHINAGVAGAPALEKGDQLGEYLLLKELARDELAAHFWARKDGRDYRLQVLGYHSSVDSARLHRLKLVLRRLSEIKHHGLEQEPELQQLDGMYAVVSRYVTGQRLSDRLNRFGTMSFGSARKLFRRILDPLAALHAVGIVHGQLCARNVLLPDGEQGDSLVLMGGGSNWLWDGTLSHSPTIAMAPELLKGGEPSPASDVYGFAALVYEVIAGCPVFSASNPQELATLHLSAEPPPLTALGGSRSVPAEIDRLLTRCLSKRPEERPPTAAELLQELQQVGSVSMYPKAILERREIELRLEALRDKPEDRVRLTSVLDTIGQGGNAREIGDELWKIAYSLNEADDVATRCRLLEETAQVYAGPGRHAPGAVAAYTAVLELQPGDAAIITPLAQLHEDEGQFEQLVEMLEQQAPSIEQVEARALAYARAADVWERKLDTVDAALADYVRAFCANPHQNDYALGVERLAPKVEGAWDVIIEECLQFATPHPNARLTPPRIAVLARLARWYDKLGQSAASEDCFRAILEAEPSNRPAFDGLTTLLRRLQRWHELAQALVDFASAADTPPIEARDLLAEAASVYADRIGAREAAAHLYQRVVSLDPGHEAACDGLLRHYEAAGEWSRYADLLASRADAFAGERKVELLCEAALAFKERLSDDDAALGLYKEVLQHAPGHAVALSGLEELYGRSGRYQELLDTLIGQLDSVRTPRKQARVWEMIGALYEEQYLDQRAAINAYHKVAELAPRDENGLLQLIRLYAVAEDYDGLAATYTKLLKHREGQPSYLETALVLAQIHSERRSSPSEAAEVLEKLREEYPAEPRLLERLAELRMTLGDLDGGLLLFDELTQQLSDSNERAAHYYSVGRLLERHGQLEEAIERYKFALDENPRARAFAVTLRDAYARLGDHSAIYELMRGDLRFAQGAVAQAKVYGELARLAHDKLGDEERAEEMAIRAEALDPTSLSAAYVRGQIAFKAERFGDAASHLQRLAGHFGHFGEKSITLWCNYALALANCGRSEQAVRVGEELIAARPESHQALRTVAGIVHEHGSPERSLQLHRVLVHRLTREDSVVDRADALFRMGSAAERSGFYTEAIAALQDSLALNASQPEALEMLSICYEHEQMWQQMADTLYSALEFAEGEHRYELLVALGDVAYIQLEEPEYAAQNYLLAHRDWPEERRVLLKLLQVYSDLERWKSVVNVILKLVDLIDDASVKARYLRVAALVTSRKLEDDERSGALIDRAMEFDPEQEELVDSALQLSRRQGDGHRLAELLKKEIRIASKHQDKGRMMAALGELADVYLNTLGRVHQAIAVHEGALELEPENEALQEYLTQAYTAHSSQYFDKAVRLNQLALDRDPVRSSAYRALRQLYTQGRNADAAWCLCRTMSVLQIASSEEIEFFERLRVNNQMAVVRDGLDPGEWTKFCLHRDCEGSLTALLSVLQPAIFAASELSRGEFMVSPADQINPVGHPSPMLSSLAYIADVIGVETPEVIVDWRSSKALSFMAGQRPLFIAGPAAVQSKAGVQEAAFTAGQALMRNLPGVGLHAVLGGSGELKVWLFAGLRMIHPSFALPAELAEDVETALGWLRAQLSPTQLEQLGWLANQLLRTTPSIDLKRWGAGVDKTADRLGFLFADDLDVAVGAIRAGNEPFAIASVDERLEALCRYSVSEQYFEARRRLGIAVA